MQGSMRRLITLCDAVVFSHIDIERDTVTGGLRDFKIYKDWKQF
jgi:hypothetical protein